MANENEVTLNERITEAKLADIRLYLDRVFPNTEKHTRESTLALVVESFHSHYYKEIRHHTTFTQWYRLVYYKEFDDRELEGTLIKLCNEYEIYCKEYKLIPIWDG